SAVRGMNRKRAIDDSGPLIAFESVRLGLFADDAGRRHEVEPGLKAAGVGAPMDIVDTAEHGAAECRCGVIAPFRKCGFSPEVESVDVAVRKIHRTLMRLVVILTGNSRRHRKAAGDDGAERAAD